MQFRSSRSHRRRATRLRVAAFVGGLVLSPSARAGAQFTVSPVQPLSFGYLTQGVSEIVPYTDTFRRGVVTIDGSGQAWIRVTLPTSLVSPQGATLPLQFLNGDLAAQEGGKAAATFDPTASVRVNLSKGTASLFIGGRAVPALTQRAGSYSATVTVIVSPTNF